MSHLTISSSTTKFTMNVVAFSSGIYQTINSAQTRTKEVHFPIKVSHPDVKFEVVFRNEREFENFQRFVRGHQQNVLGVTSLLTLSWPERNIYNWTGVIEDFKAGGERRNYAPRAEFVVTLVDSLVSSRTSYASIAAPWQSIYGGWGMAVDSVLTPPASYADSPYLNFGIGAASVPYGAGGGLV